MMYSWLMIRTQVQIPNELYASAKRVAERREISLAEVVRRGLEYMIAVSKDVSTTEDWQTPRARPLGGANPFSDPDWRGNVHLSRLRVAEEPPAYQVSKPGARKRKR